MAKTWVLHTETKGTGAQMVPLESVAGRRSATEPVLVPRKSRRRRPAPAPAPKPPRRFKIVDVLSRQTLVQDADAREAVDVLAGVHSMVDVNVYLWREDRGDWRLLTLDEQRTLWDLVAASKPTSGAGKNL